MRDTVLDTGSSSRRELLASALGACLLATTGVGCDAVPYRVEWGFGREAKERVDRGESPSDPRSEDAALTREQAWISWDSLHAGLARTLADWDSRRPKPHETFEVVLRAVDRVASFEGADPAQVAAARTAYTELESDLGTLPTLALEQRMTEIRTRVEGLRAAPSVE